MSDSLQVSLEAIAFQSDGAFVNTLKTLFQNAIDAAGDLRAIDAALTEISSLTLDRTGVWFEPSLVKAGLFENNYRLVMVDLNFNTFSPINPKAQKRLEMLDLNSMMGKELINGWVDLKNAKVGGFFSKIRNNWQIAPKFFDGTFTAGEILSLYFHELGHVFTIYEYMGETFVTNVILAEVVGRMDSQETITKKLWVGRCALKLAGVNTRTSDDVTAGEIAALVMEGQVTRMQRAVGTRWYDDRLGEAVADQFAARWGMAADLARALTKQERAGGIFADAGYEPVWLGVLMNVANFCTLPFSSVSQGVSRVLVATLANIAKTFGVNFAIGSGLFFMMGKSKYNTLPERISQLRRELGGVLRDRNIDEATRKRVLTDIQELDEIAEMRHEWSDVYSKVARYALGAVTGRDAALGQETMTEELANNRLYTLAASLKG